METLLSMFLLHWSPAQFHNTAWHLSLGLALAGILLAFGLPARRTILLVTLYAFLREFAWQLPFEDAFHLKLADRVLDTSEWTLGALVAIPFVAPLTVALDRLARWAGEVLEILLLRVLPLAQAVRALSRQLRTPASPAAR